MNTQSIIWVSPKAEKLAYKLIGKLQVHRGNKLAPALGLPEYYNNYEAVQLWVEEMLATYHQEELDLSKLCSLFLDTIPRHLQGSLD